MKKILDWKSKEVVNVYDEVNLWSAPFGRLLLEQMPVRQGVEILDIGFGTGFPLIELSQRFGVTSKVHGIDIWQEGINRCREKIKVLEIGNIEIIEESAVKINLEDDQVDIITSNLGVNNFAEKEKVYAEIKRVLKKNGRLCITTNPIGTFKELFELFLTVLAAMELPEELEKVKDYIDHRATKERIVEEFGQHGLNLVKSHFDTTNMRFADAHALLDHPLIRVGFREYWENMIRENRRKEFFKRLVDEMNTVIEAEGEFKMTIPMLYLEFEKG